MTRSLSFTALSIGIVGLIIGYSVTLIMQGGIAFASTPHCPKAAECNGECKKHCDKGTCGSTCPGCAHHE